MFDFETKLSQVLCYCGKDYKTVAADISKRSASFDLLAQTDPSVISGLCSEKYSTMIRILSAIAARRITDSFKFGRTHTEKEIFDFLCGYYFDAVNETVIVLPLDERGRIISADVVVEGTVNFSGVLPRKLLEIMIKRKSKSAILVHNHPGGKATPSVEDVETTRIVSDLLISADKRLVCHYIVAGNDIARLDPPEADN